nr:immunoglobulin light chain junction region [Macaca mulatta]MOV37144.1 immunoglobulin light chain junction region [Macaca mulatta]
CQQHDNSPYNF